jgi:pyroglutamyl-peptidase
MPNILITGFAPFNQETINPSWEVVKQFEGRQISNSHDIQIAQLACEFGLANEQLHALLEQHQPEIAICIGQAGGRAEISIERVAINVDDARIPDNAGAQPIDEPIAADGPAAYFSSLPLKALVKNLRDNNIPANISQTAGTYVCNHVFYGLMHYANTHPNLKRAGYVHIPYLPSQACHHPGAESISMETLEKALSLLVETTVKVNPSSDLPIKLSAGTIC